MNVTSSDWHCFAETSGHIMHFPRNCENANFISGLPDKSCMIMIHLP